MLLFSSTEIYGVAKKKLISQILDVRDRTFLVQIIGTLFYFTKVGFLKNKFCRLFFQNPSIKKNTVISLREILSNQLLMVICINIFEYRLTYFKLIGICPELFSIEI